MAVVSVWHRESNTNGLIDYINNPEKTTTTIDALFDYTVDEKKTHDKLYVSGINCSPETASEEWLVVKNQWNKLDGYIAWHGIQSFKPGETDPNTAHRIGLEFANRMWGDRFQVVVTTHLDKEHLHNHFAINSVSFVDGKKFHRDNKHYREMKNTNDEICLAHGLDVITQTTDEKSKVSGFSWRDKIRRDVDRAVGFCKTLEDLERFLTADGYEIKSGRKHLTVRPPGKERFVRIYSLGFAYTSENLIRRMNNLEPVQSDVAENRKNLKSQDVYVRDFFHYQTQKRGSVLGRRYLHVIVLVGRGKALPYQSPEIKRAVRNLNRMTDQILWLRSKNISKLSEIIKLNDSLRHKQDLLLAERKSSYRLLRTVPDEELNSVKEHIDQLSFALRDIYRDKRFAENILYEYPKLKAVKERDKIVKSNIVLVKDERDIKDERTIRHER